MRPVILALPSAIPRTSPVVSIIATDGSLDDHQNSAPATGYPFASNASAARRSVSPGPMVASAGVTVTEVADCVTDTEAVPEAETRRSCHRRSSRTLRPDEPCGIHRHHCRVPRSPTPPLAPGIARPALVEHLRRQTDCVAQRRQGGGVGVTATVVGAAGRRPPAGRVPPRRMEVAVISAAPGPTPPHQAGRVHGRPPACRPRTTRTPPPTPRCPSASRAVADSRTVSPTTSAAVSGVTDSASTDCSTVTEAVPDAEPEAAVIVAVPLPVAVASPEPSTAATATSELAHSTDAPDMARPLWSRTSAESATVSPMDDSEAEAGVTATVVARGGGGGGGCGRLGRDHPPHASPPSRTTAAPRTPTRIQPGRGWREPPLAPGARLTNGCTISLRDPVRKEAEGGIDSTCLPPPKKYRGVEVGFVYRPRGGVRLRAAGRRSRVVGDGASWGRPPDAGS